MNSFEEALKNNSLEYLYVSTCDVAWVPTADHDAPSQISTT